MRIVQYKCPLRVISIDECLDYFVRFVQTCTASVFVLFMLYGSMINLVLSQLCVISRHMACHLCPWI